MLVIQGSPIEFLVLGDKLGHDELLVHSEGQQLDLLGFAAALVLQDLSKEQTEEVSKSGRGMQSVKSQPVKPFDPKVDDRKSAYQFCWVGECSDHDKEHIRKLFDKSIIDLQKSIANNNLDQISWILSPIIFHCSIAHSGQQRSIAQSGEPLKQGNSDINTLKYNNLVKSNTFLPNLILLTLTIIAFGLISDRLIIIAIERRTVAEIGISRDIADRQALTKFMEEISETILTYETLALGVSWYKTHDAVNQDFHQKAFAQYRDRLVDLVSKWRALIIKANNLGLKDTSENLDRFLTRVFIEQDSPINQLHEKNASTSEWDQQHDKSLAILKAANQMLTKISDQIKQSGQSP